MKTLYIVRHAKSSWDYPQLKDHDRPLLPKGRKRTLKIADFLKNNDVEVDLMLSSTAVRAYETSRIIAEKINYPEENIVKEKGLYHSDPSGILDYLFGIDNKHGSVMIFGHNPTFTFLANKFLQEPVDWMPTSAVVSIVFDTDKWEDIMLSERKMNFVVFPKML